MRYAQKLICLLLLVLSASFGVGGCYLLYSDFGVQLERTGTANAAAHAQTCTLLQTEILDLQRRGDDTGDETVAALLEAQGAKAALWRGGTLLYSALAVPCDAPAGKRHDAHGAQRRRGGGTLRQRSAGRPAPGQFF